MTDTTTTAFTPASAQSAEAEPVALSAKKRRRRQRMLANYCDHSVRAELNQRLRALIAEMKAAKCELEPDVLPLYCVVGTRTDRNGSITTVTPYLLKYTAQRKLPVDREWEGKYDHEIKYTIAAPVYSGAYVVFDPVPYAPVRSQR